MNKLGKPHGAIGVSGHDGIITPAYFVANIAANAEPRFVHHLLRTRLYISEYERRGKFMPPSQFDISWEDFRSISVVMPPLAAQRAIADYLDRETARIDALIVAKQRMVELLEERAVAFIEDSARDAGWESAVLTRVIRRIEQGWSPQCEARLPDEGEWGVLKVGCVNHGEFKADEAKALPIELAPRTEYRVRNGDLLMSRANTRDLVGSTAVVSGVRPNTLLCDKLYRIFLDERKAVR